MAKMLIGGELVDSVSGQTYEVRNPATGAVVGTVPKGNEKDVQQAVGAAETAFKEWSDVTPEDRGAALTNACALIKKNGAEIAQLLTQEQGKTLFEAGLEIHHLVHGLEFYAGLASKVRGSHVPLPQKGAYGMVVRQPIGVCGGIVPWNFPLTLMGTKLGPALAAGNTIIIKPASTTPLATVRVIELIAQATFGEGKAQKTLPKGTVQVVTGPGSTVGEEILRNPRIRRIAFTGSTPVGRHVMEVAGREIKRVTLELGGSDPMIVMDDANLELAIKMADIGRFFNCGQMCLGVKRLFLQESIAESFAGKLADILKTKTVGNGASKETRMGPIHLEAQRKEIEEQVEDAKARGAKVIFGGERAKGGELDKGFFYLPTLLTNVSDDARVSVEETFGPVLPVFTFKTLDEALAKANSSEFGLGSSIWTRSLVSANKAIDKLQAGNVWVNSLHYGYDELPFGGVKSSGLGREHGPEALDYYLEPKGVVIVNV
ncbi:MAG: NAD-dependent succinate-semialdehyde dehydrogenase [Deltaproteobacteria bacterium RIFCSPLOWO2_12_FULL_60_19]|nr:MAG: NAD-dependent succinate-semialdehyde dehydrogenase [Deltaproteobacteria bacterium RIFCSPLOWO2_12_FULL_60_19]